jgi:DNA replication protein DnaC
MQEQAEKSKTLYSQASFENFTTELKYQERGHSAAVKFVCDVQKGQPIALLLYSHPIPGHSGYGTGKTHLASAISNQLRGVGWNILSWLAPDLFSEIKGTYDKDADQTEWQIIRMATECDLLVFDDVGKEHVRPENRSWHHDLYYRIINARYQRGPLVVTTNIDAERLPAHIGGGAFSRLWEMCEGKKLIIKMCGPDYRFLKNELEDKSGMTEK